MTKSSRGKAALTLAVATGMGAFLFSPKITFAKEVADCGFSIPEYKYTAQAPDQLRALVSNTYVLLQWSMAGLPSNKSGGMDYALYRTEGENMNFASQQPLAVFPVGGFIFSDTSAEPGKKYNYKVALRYKTALYPNQNQGGCLATNDPYKEGPNSNLVSVTVPANRVPLSKPALSGSTGNLGEVILNWTPVKDATKYTLYRKIDAKSFDVLREGIVGTGFVDYYADAGSKASYFVVPRLQTGGLGSSSDVFVQELQPATDPKALAMREEMRQLLVSNVVVDSASLSQVKLSWTPVATAASYKILRSDSTSGVFYPLAAVAGDVKTYTDTKDLQPGATYYYRILVVTREGNETPISLASQISVMVPEATPSVPGITVGLPNNVTVFRGGAIQLPITFFNPLNKIFGRTKVKREIINKNTGAVVATQIGSYVTDAATRKINFVSNTNIIGVGVVGQDKLDMSWQIGTGFYPAGKYIAKISIEGTYETNRSDDGYNGKKTFEKSFDFEIVD